MRAKVQSQRDGALIPGIHLDGLRGLRRGVSAAKREERGREGVGGRPWRGRAGNREARDPETRALGEAGCVQYPGGTQLGAPRLGGGGAGQLPAADREMSRREATWGQGMPGQSWPRLGVRWTAADGQRGWGGFPNAAAASAASPLPGMSEEPPRRLPSMLGSAASPTALGGGHSARPGSPPSPPGASSSQPSPAPQSSPHATRVLRPPQHRLRLSPTQRQPPASRAGAESHACGDWLSGPG